MRTSAEDGSSFLFSSVPDCEHFKTIQNSNCHQCYHPLASCSFRERDRKLDRVCGKASVRGTMSHMMTAVREED